MPIRTSLPALNSFLTIRKLIPRLETAESAIHVVFSKIWQRQRTCLLSDSSVKHSPKNLRSNLASDGTWVHRSPDVTGLPGVNPSKLFFYSLLTTSFFLLFQMPSQPILCLFVSKSPQLRAMFVPLFRLLELKSTSSEWLAFRVWTTCVILENTADI